MAITDKLRAMIRHQGGSVSAVDTIEKGLKELDGLEDNPLAGLVVDATIGASVDLLGKYVGDLEEDIVVSNGSISGTLKYVTEYTGFSGDLEEQEGNYLALYYRVPEVDDVTIKVTTNTSTVTLDPDGLHIIRIKGGKVVGKKITVTASKEGYKSVKRVYALDNLVCEPASED